MYRGRSSEAIYFPRIDGPLVVLEDQLQIISDRIMKGSTQLDIVSIVGVSGLGKTTMAKKLYNDLARQFQIRSWCSISRKFDKRELQLNILNHVIDLHDFSDKMSTEESCPPKLVDVGKELAKSCKGLPLSIVVLGGLLATMERKQESWEQIRRGIWSPKQTVHLP